MSSLYLHIPFCERKCLYCDFYSVEGVARMDRFLSALHREIDLYSEYTGTFETIFLGGGTPSLLTPEQLQKILSHLRDRFHVKPDAEVTLETNPGTVDARKLADFRASGVNRLSVGIQSFVEEELRFLSRIHTADEATRCIRDAREQGFGNISIDLIYSLPGQDRTRWERTLTEALALRPDHVSAYSLIVEENTPLWRLVADGRVVPNSLESEAELYEFTMDFMAAHGYEHYEVSNYAKPGFRCRHNHAYWSHENYLGFGPSAHSFWIGPSLHEGNRWANVASVEAYCRMLEEGHPPVEFREVVARKELANERMFLGLRSDGVNFDRLVNDLGMHLTRNQKATVSHLVAEGLAILQNETLRLTPRGFLLCDEIAERMMI